MFITAEDLNLISRYHNPKGAITIYLYMNSEERDGDLITRLRSFLDSIHRDISGESRELQLFTRNAQELEQIVLDSFIKGKARSVCIFWAKDFLKIFDVPVRLKEMYKVNSSFYTLPIKATLAQFERFAVFVFNRNKARLYSYFLGQIKEETYIFHDYVLPNIRTSVGSNNSYKEKTLSNKKEDGYRKHLRDISAILFKYLSSFDKLILASHQDELPAIKEYLHSYLTPRIIGEFAADVDDHIMVIREKAEQCVAAYRRAREQKILSNLYEDSARNKAVLGAESVVDALMVKNVKDLIVSSDFHVEGFSSLAEDFLSVNMLPDKRFSPDNVPLQPSRFLEDEIAEKAFRQSSNVFHVFYPDEIFSKYNIGATLRY